MKRKVKVASVGFAALVGVLGGSGISHAEATRYSAVDVRFASVSISAKDVEGGNIVMCPPGFYLFKTEPQAYLTRNIYDSTVTWGPPGDKPEGVAIWATKAVAGKTASFGVKMWCGKPATTSASSNS